MENSPFLPAHIAVYQSISPMFFPMDMARMETLRFQELENPEDAIGEQKAWELHNVPVIS